MEPFLWSLTLATVSALTFTAYKHPRAFAQNIFLPLTLLTTFLFVIMFASYMGSMGSLTNTLRQELARANDEFNRIELVNRLEFVSEEIITEYIRLKYSFFLGSVVIVYLLLLRLLPRILGFGHHRGASAGDGEDA